MPRTYNYRGRPRYLGYPLIKARAERSRRANYRRNKQASFNTVRRAKTRIPLPLGGFPNSLMVRLKYVQTFSLNPAAGAIAVQNFRANSLYDPDSTGVGHQPSNYDRLTAIYDRYTVVGAKIKVYPVFLTTGSINCGTLVVHCSENGTDLTVAHAAGGIANCLEQPKIARSAKHIGVINSGMPHVWTKTFSAKKFFGVKNFIGKEPYSADNAANPVEQAFFEVAIMSQDDSVDPDTIKLRAEIEYIAVMTEPNLTDNS